jgi:hypothetical protein
MRIIGLFLIGLMFGWCTTPVFPSKVMKSVERIPLT